MTFHKWKVGLGLAALMVGVLFFNAILFSARSFQFNIASLGQNTQGIVSVEAIALAEERLATIEQSTALPRAELSQIGQELAA